MTARLSCALVCLVGVLAAHQLSYSPGQFSFESEREFQRVVAKDFYRDGPPGYPELPVRFLTYILPPGVTADSVNVKTCEYKLIGDYYLYPSQPSVPLDSTPPWVPPDSTIYSSKSPYPAAPTVIVERGFFDGAGLVTVAVHPLMYKPALRKVYVVSRIEFEFFTSEAASRSRAKIRGINAQKTYDLALRAVIENDNEIPAYYQPPMLTQEQPPEAGERSPFPYPTTYTIITNDLLADSFQPYADWLTDKGIPARVVRLSQFLLDFPGVDSAERLRNYLKFGYEQCGTVWVLLGGDAGVVPFRYGWCDSTNTVPPPGNNSPYAMPSDLYFSDMNGDWDCDPAGPDGRWGEPYHDAVDIYPELLVGRLTVRSDSTVHNWVRKALRYERQGSDDLSQFNRAIWIYDSTDFTVGYYLYPYQETRGTFPGYFSHTNYNAVVAPVARDAFGRALAYPGGAYPAAGLYNINCHGSPRNFACQSFVHDPGPNEWREWWLVWALNPNPETDHEAGLQYCDLTGRHYVVYDMGCYTAAFDSFEPHAGYLPSDTIMADAYTNFYPTTMGVAHLGNTRYGYYWASQELQHQFWRLLFDSGDPQHAPTPSLGLAEGMSKVAYPNHYLRHAHNLFGSPENEPWIMAPESMYVEAPQWISQGAALPFLVRVTDGNDQGIANIKVCLYKVNDIYQIGWTDAQGEVTFIVQAGSPGAILVTCTSTRQTITPEQQYLPAQAICMVIPRGGEGPQAEESGLPKELGFTTSSANPVLGDFTAQYGVPVKGRVRLTLYDVQGRVKMAVADREMSPGYYRLAIKRQSRSLPSGIYYLTLSQQGNQVTKKLALVD